MKRFVLQSEFDNTTSDDSFQNDALITIFLTCLLLQMKDVAAEGDDKPKDSSCCFQRTQ